MINFIKEGGVIMYPLLIVTLIVAVHAIRAWLRLRRGDASAAVTGTGIDAVAFWGGYAAVLGVLGTLVGISQAAGFIESAPAVSASMVWGGIRIALSTTIYGLLVFAVALLLWFGLRHGRRKRLASGAQ